MTELVLTPTDTRDAPPLLTMNQQIAAFVTANTMPNSSPYEIGHLIQKFIATTKLAPTLDGEPVFVFRARDRFAPYYPMAWAGEAEFAGVSAAKVNGARDIAAAMLVWQNANPALVKIPD